MADNVHGGGSAAQSLELRDLLIRTVNGHPISADEAWELIHEWDRTHPVEGEAREFALACLDDLAVHDLKGAK